MKRLILVRHGETEWNAARRLQGQTDIALSDHGRAQARALAPHVAVLAPDQAATSDLMRARETSALLGFAAAQPMSALREQSLGDWSGREISALMAAVPEDYRNWRAGTYTPPGGETWAEFRNRIASALHGLMQGAGAVTLVTCHGGVIRAALDALLDLPPSRLIPVGPASMTLIAHDSLNFRLEGFNLAPGRLDLTAPD